MTVRDNLLYKVNKTFKNFLREREGNFVREEKSLHRGILNEMGTCSFNSYSTCDYFKNVRIFGIEHLYKLHQEQSGITKKIINYR